MAEVTEISEGPVPRVWPFVRLPAPGAPPRRARARSGTLVHTLGVCRDLGRIWARAPGSTPPHGGIKSSTNGPPEALFTDTFFGRPRQGFADQFVVSMSVSSSSSSSRGIGSRASGQHTNEHVNTLVHTLGVRRDLGRIWVLALAPRRPAAASSTLCLPQGRTRHPQPLRTTLRSRAPEQKVDARAGA